MRVTVLINQAPEPVPVGRTAGAGAGAEAAPLSPGMRIVAGAGVLSQAQTAAPLEASQRMLLRMLCTASSR